MEWVINRSNLAGSIYSTNNNHHENQITGNW